MLPLILRDLHRINTYGVWNGYGGMTQAINFVSGSQFDSIDCPFWHTFKTPASGAMPPRLFANWLAQGNAKRSTKGIAKAIAKGITKRFAKGTSRDAKGITKRIVKVFTKESPMESQRESQRESPSESPKEHPGTLRESPGIAKGITKGFTKVIAKGTPRTPRESRLFLGMAAGRSRESATERCSS